MAELRKPKYHAGNSMAFLVLSVNPKWCPFRLTSWSEDDYLEIKSLVELIVDSDMIYRKNYSINMGFKNRPKLELLRQESGESDEGRNKKQEVSEKSLADKFFGGSDFVNTNEIREKAKNLPSIVQREVINQLEKVETSVETFENEYNNKVERVKQKIEELKGAAESEKLRNVSLEMIIEDQIVQSGKWLENTMMIFRKYSDIPKEHKQTFIAQELRDVILESLSLSEDSLNNLSKMI